MIIGKSRPIEAPVAYSWMVDHGLVRYSPGSSLEPWYFLSIDEVFEARDKWPQRQEDLIVFARRQDNDLLACFRLDSDRVVEVVVINGWTSDGYDFLSTYSTLWEWFKSVVDDIAEIAEPDPEP
jgi:hypothetical protein